MTPWLTEEELRTMTGYLRPSAQRRWLVKAGVPFCPRPDGSIVVFRADLGGRSMDTVKVKGPNFEAVRQAG